MNESAMPGGQIIIDISDGAEIKVVGYHGTGGPWASVDVAVGPIVIRNISVCDGRLIPGEQGEPILPSGVSIANPELISAITNLAVYQHLVDDPEPTTWNAGKLADSAASPASRDEQ